MGIKHTSVISLCFILTVSLFILPVSAAEIHDAAGRGDLSKVKELLENTPSLVDEKNERGKTPLHFAAERGHVEVVGYLLEKGADVDAKNLAGETPLHYAAGYSHIEVIKLLLKSGADVNARSDSEDTALLYVGYMGVKEAAEILLAHGADVNARNNSGRSILLQAFSIGNLDLINLLLENGAEIDTKSDEGMQMLISSVRMANSELFKFLLTKGVQISEGEEDTNLLLHLAAKSYSQEIVNLVIEKKPDWKSLSESGGTLLHSAAEGNLVEFGRAMLKKGVDLNAVDKLGRTALKVSKDWGNSEFSRLLQDAGAVDTLSPVIPVVEASAEEGKKRTSVEITYIANEGFMISGSSKNIIVDALFRSPFGYINTPTLIYERMKSALDPFEKLDLILFSHAHWDHYTPEMAFDVLKSHSEAVLIGNSITVGGLKQTSGEEYAGVSARVAEYNPEWGSVLDEKVNGVNLKIFPVNHGMPEQPYVTLAYLLDLDGMKILHLGDISPPSNVEYFKKYGMEGEGIDIALVDPFFLQDENGQKILKDHIRPKKIILMHMRSNEVDRYYEELEKLYPNIVVFYEPMQKKVFQKDF